MENIEKYRQMAISAMTNQSPMAHLGISAWSSDEGIYALAKALEEMCELAASLEQSLEDE